MAVASDKEINLPDFNALTVSVAKPPTNPVNSTDFIIGPAIALAAIQGIRSSIYSCSTLFFDNSADTVEASLSLFKLSNNGLRLSGALSGSSIYFLYAVK